MTASARPSSGGVTIEGRGGAHERVVARTVAWAAGVLACGLAPKLAERAGVADLRWLRLSGVIAWVTWVVVHLWYLIGFQNRVLVVIRWGVQLLHARARRTPDNRNRRPVSCRPTIVLVHGAWTDGSS